MGIASFNEEPAKLTYDYIMGFENINMDVTVYPDYDGGKKESRQPGNSGGCNAVSVLPLFAVMIILVAGIKRHFYKRI